MTKSLSRTLFVSIAGLIAGWFAVAPLAHALDDADFDIDPKFRAKIAKQKAKQASQQSTQQKNGSSTGDECGTQNIGNVQSGGIGRGPREVFVFAPNSINVVSGSGCK